MYIYIYMFISIRETIGSCGPHGKLVHEAFQNMSRPAITFLSRTIRAKGFAFVRAAVRSCGGIRTLSRTLRTQDSAAVLLAAAFGYSRQKQAKEQWFAHLVQFV